MSDDATALGRKWRTPQSIEDFCDPRVDAYRNVRDADLRGRDDLFMAESELVLRRLLRTPERLHSVLLSPEKFRRLESALAVLPQSTPILVADLALIHEIAAFHVHRGVLAAGYRLPREQLSIDAALGHLRGTERCTLMIAEGITNVDNMGALFRNAAAFGVDGVVLDPSCCDPLYRKAIRVSMGHALSVPYAVASSWPGDLERLRRGWNISLVAMELSDRSQPLWTLPKGERVALIFGSEGHGLSSVTLAQCDHVCAIPMAGAGHSLNVAVASAIALYELKRSSSTHRGGCGDREAGK